MKKISEGKSYEEISKEFGRTRGGITSRLKQIACEMVELGKSIEYASEKTTIPIDDIKRIIIDIVDNKSVLKNQLYSRMSAYKERNCQIIKSEINYTDIIL